MKEIELNIIRMNNGLLINPKDKDIKDVMINGVVLQQTYSRQYGYTESLEIKNVKVFDKYNIKKSGYRIIDETIATEKAPLFIDNSERANYSDELIERLYNYYSEYYEPDFFDTQFIVKSEIEVPIDYITFSFDAITILNYDERKIKITPGDTERQLLDKIMFPEYYMSELPSKLSSIQLYEITRQYIKEHIDLSVANITSDYDFCFTVKKKIPLIEPSKVTWEDYSARKNPKNRFKTYIREYTEVDCFEMTSEEKHYRGYTPIPSITAKNDRDMKERIESWLEYVMNGINAKIEMCPHCNGTGHLKIREISIKQFKEQQQ